MAVIAQSAASPDSEPVVTIGPPPSDAAHSRREEEFRTLWDSEYPKLAGWAARLTRSREDGHDIAQQAFLQLFQRWFTARDPKAVLWRTASRLFIDGWRREQRDRRLRLLLSVSTPRSSEMADTSIRDLVERLPDHLRHPILLYYWSDRSVQEVADLLDRPAGTVKRQLHEARNTLRSHIELPEVDE
jgi:RNA polymerase sigma-70 factor (ECF subfamily)